MAGTGKVYLKPSTICIRFLRRLRVVYLRCGFDPDACYQIALSCRESILQFGDTRSLIYLLLLGQFVSFATELSL